MLLIKEMKLVFLTNLVNYHQIYLADELYKILGLNYTYVAFEPLPEWLKKGGYSEITRPYILNAYESETKYAEAVNLAYEADVVIIGSASESLVHKRLYENKLTFHYSERWFKKKLGLRMFSPRMWYSVYKNHLRFNRKRSYMLCASAYTAYDVNSVHAYINKCFKWGYFPKVEDINIDDILSSKKSGIIKLMWCARFLKLKHPELPVNMAYRLKERGYKFSVDMYGSGEELQNSKELAKKLGVEDIVNFKGNFPNDVILEEMRNHHIFLFTSDRNEGWGAVLNEAMANGCSVVASNEIGSVPFLIKDGVNGLVFKSQDIDSLVQKVELLMRDSDMRESIAKEAYSTMRYVWSPENAAKSLVELIEGLMSDSSYGLRGDGPCTKAEIIKG